MSRLGNKKVRWSYEGKTTTCTILDSTDNVLATGTTTRFHKDLQNKRKGRKVSFEQAMNQAANTNSISKADRGQIWNDFRNNIKQPKHV